MPTTLSPHEEDAEPAITTEFARNDRATVTLEPALAASRAAKPDFVHGRIGQSERHQGGCL